MATSQAANLAEQSAERPGPHLRVHAVNVFVRDQEQSRRFYLEQLDFTLAYDIRLQSGQRWLGVAPPDGTAVLSLIAPEVGSEQYQLIGRPTGIVFVTEDIASKYAAWRKRGVRFRHTPRLRRMKYEHVEHGETPSLLLGKQTPVWGSVFTRFEDLDGNVFTLISIDEMTQAVEAQRRQATAKQESERRAAHEIGDCAAGAVQALPAKPSPNEDTGLCGSLHSGQPGRR